MKISVFVLLITCGKVSQISQENRLILYKPVLGIIPSICFVISTATLINLFLSMRGS